METERNYVSHLKMISLKFIEPLKNKLDAKDLQTIFINSEVSYVQNLQRVCFFSVARLIPLYLFMTPEVCAQSMVWSVSFHSLILFDRPFLKIALVS